MNRLMMLLVAAALSFGTTSTIAREGEIGDGYDQQQWWNPGDWFDSRTNTWDYQYDWGDRDWYEDEEYGAGAAGLDDESYTREGYEDDDTYDYYQGEDYDWNEGS